MNPTKQEHLDLIALHHLVALELVINLLVAGLPLLVLSTHSATHFGDFCVVRFLNENRKDGRSDRVGVVEAIGV